MSKLCTFIHELMLMPTFKYFKHLLCCWRSIIHNREIKMKYKTQQYDPSEFFPTSLFPFQRSFGEKLNFKPLCIHLPSWKFFFPKNDFLKTFVITLVLTLPHPNFVGKVWVPPYNFTNFTNFNNLNQFICHLTWKIIPFNV